MALLAVVVSITGNMYAHWYTVKEVQTEQKKLFPISSNEKLKYIISENVGTKSKEVVVVSKDKADALQLSIQKPSLEHEIHMIRTVHTEAIVKSTTLTYVYKNPLAKILFSISGNDKCLEKTISTVHIPKTWEVFTEKQADYLEAKQKEMSSEAGVAKEKAKAESYVKNEVKKELQKIEKKAVQGDNDALSLLMDKVKLQAKQKEFIQKFTVQYQEIARLALLEDVKKR
jgi:hypothetical protein